MWGFITGFLAGASLMFVALYACGVALNRSAKEGKKGEE